MITNTGAPETVITTLVLRIVITLHGKITAKTLLPLDSPCHRCPRYPIAKDILATLMPRRNILLDTIGKGSSMQFKINTCSNLECFTITSTILNYCTTSTRYIETWASDWRR